MNTKNFEALFTHQKQKKNKTWQDGVLKVTCDGTKAVLYDDSGASLEVFHIQSNKVFVGSDLECERYLISMGEEKRNSNISTSNLNVNGSSGLVGCGKRTPVIDNSLRKPFARKRKRELYAGCRPDLPSPSDLSGTIFNEQRERDKNIYENPKPTWGDLPYPNHIANNRTSTTSVQPGGYEHPNADFPSSIRNTRPSNTANDYNTPMRSELTSGVNDTSLSFQASLRDTRTSNTANNHAINNHAINNHAINNHAISMRSHCLTSRLQDSSFNARTSVGNNEMDPTDNLGEPTMSSAFGQPCGTPTLRRNRTELLSLFSNKTKGINSGNNVEKRGHEICQGATFGGQRRNRLKDGDKGSYTCTKSSNLDEWNDEGLAARGGERVDGNIYCMEREIDNNECLRGFEKDQRLLENLSPYWTSKSENADHIAFTDYAGMNSKEQQQCAVINHESSRQTANRENIDGNIFSNFMQVAKGVEFSASENANDESTHTNVSSKKMKWGVEKDEGLLNNLTSPPICDDFEGFYDLMCDPDDFMNSIDFIDNFNTMSDNKPTFLNAAKQPDITIIDSDEEERHSKWLGNDITTTHFPKYGDARERMTCHTRSELTNTQRPTPLSSAIQPMHRTQPNVPIRSTQQSIHSTRNVHTVVPNKPSFGEFNFPPSTECCGNVSARRQVTIPIQFPSALEYKQIFKSAIKEHLNIILFKLAQSYHGVLSVVDITSAPNSLYDEKENIKGPSCSHGQANLHAVKKDGPNKGRHFYSCAGSGSNQCKFFKWADECSTTCSNGNKRLPLTSTDSIRVYFKSKNIHLYHDCVLERRTPHKKIYKNKYKYARRGSCGMDNDKKAMYIILKYRESSSLYSKDDIWVVSKSVNFEPGTTFIAKSLFYGPSSSCELEVEPVSGYSPSNWKSGDTVHAIWACNAGTELSCIKNLEEHVTLQHLPVLPYILNRSQPRSNVRRTVQCSTFQTPLNHNRNSLGLTTQQIEEQTEIMIIRYKLNEDQATAIRACARMFINNEETEIPPVTLIHGVFGAGKSFLLAVVVLLMVNLFEMAVDHCSPSSVDWKILISSTTNVAVDRILLGILDLGFDQFVRVGSVRKIAKPVLPFSIHSIGGESQELKELQGMLKSDLTAAEKSYVRKSIERQKLGENRKRLSNVRVVGVTCAACMFPSMQKLKFPVLLLDECSQMTEPNSLLPMARFGCRKLVLVGDPKQLNPTIQGSEAEHESGLEQTLFDRLMKMEIQPILLRTQYRCHPNISSVANRLFYNNSLLDGVTTEQRKPIVDFLPTLCFYNVPKGKEECSQDGSYFNKNEANFVVFLIKSLLESDVEPTQIGVITQYKSQLTTITNSLMSDQSTSHKELKGIQISTVDAFQGGEKDVIILSCVRTRHVGFIDCKRRTNVALTRAKRHLCIVGCAKMLSSNSLWGKIITFCRENEGGVRCSEQYIDHWNEIKQLLPSKDISTKTKKSKKGTPKQKDVKTGVKTQNYSR